MSDEASVTFQAPPISLEANRHYITHAGDLVLITETSPPHAQPNQIGWARGYFQRVNRPDSAFTTQANGGGSWSWNRGGLFSYDGRLSENIVREATAFEIIAANPPAQVTSAPDPVARELFTPFEVDYTYELRNGSRMRVTEVANNTDDLFPISGNIGTDDDEEADQSSWTREGFYNEDRSESEFDVMSDWYGTRNTPAPRPARPRLLGWITPKNFMAFRVDGDDHPGPEWRRAPWLDQPEVVAR